MGIQIKSERQELYLNS